MAHEQVTVRTADGDMPTHVFTPEGKGSGPWPAVIFCMDGLAIRSPLLAMAQRMADGGYLVALPDLFWRAGPYPPLDPKEIFSGGSVREKLGHLMGSTNFRKAAEDIGPVIDYLDTRRDVLGKKIGTTGYCMGGAVALTVAGLYPDRIAAAAAFHAGNVATDDEISPHKLAPSMKGRIYVAGADNDQGYPPEMAARMEKALSDAGVDHRCEIYEGALHGWTMTDFPPTIYNEAAAERHWRELFKLFGDTLG
jgi:carboxymethylenebutenolidase